MGLPWITNQGHLISSSLRALDFHEPSLKMFVACSKCNKYSNQLRFTTEKEHSNYLSFLDTLIIKQNNGKLLTNSQNEP